MEHPQGTCRRIDVSPVRCVGISFVLGLWLVAAAAWGEEASRGSDAAVRAIIQSALDEALKTHVEKLFATWMKDPTAQPGRAAAGIRRAVRSYRQAIHAIETEKLTGR